MTTESNTQSDDLVTTHYGDQSGALGTIITTNRTVQQAAEAVAEKLEEGSDYALVATDAVRPLALGFRTAIIERNKAIGAAFEARRTSRPEDLAAIAAQSDALVAAQARIEELESHLLDQALADSVNARLDTLEATAQDIRARQQAAEDHIAEIESAQTTLRIEGGVLCMDDPKQREALARALGLCDTAAPPRKTTIMLTGSGAGMLQLHDPKQREALERALGDLTGDAIIGRAATPPAPTYDAQGAAVDPSDTTVQ